MNIDRLNQLIDRLRRLKNTPSAGRFNMQHFGMRITYLYGTPTEMLEHPPCNTQACLAGEAVLMTGRAYIPSHGGIVDRNGAWFKIPDRAQRILGLTASQSMRLFMPGNAEARMELSGNAWPRRYQRQYEAAETPNDRIDVAIRRVRHFIKTNGEE